MFSELSALDQARRSTAMLSVTTLFRVPVDPVGCLFPHPLFVMTVTLFSQCKTIWVRRNPLACARGGAFSGPATVTITMSLVPHLLVILPPPLTVLLPELSLHMQSPAFFLSRRSLPRTIPLSTEPLSKVTAFFWSPPPRVFNFF